MFQWDYWDAVDNSPYLRDQMSSKPSKWLFDLKGERHERNCREFFVAGFIFTYVQKHFANPLGRGAIAPIAPPLPLWIRQWIKVTKMTKIGIELTLKPH